MKTFKLIFLFLIFNFNFSFSQTYSYSKKTVKIKVQTENGYEFRTQNVFKGPYKFVFEKPRNEKKLFTILKPNDDSPLGIPWYGLLDDVGYVELNNKVFKKSIYFFTGDETRVNVLISEDWNVIIIFNRDGTIWEFSD